MKSKYFKIHELVPEHLYNKLGEKAWKLIDNRIIEAIDFLKENFPKGTMTINNYHWNGDRNWSGLRTPESKYYRQTSQHSFGRAVDIIFSDYNIEDVRKFIIDNIDKLLIRGMELEVPWLHIDVRNEDSLVTFKP